MFQVSKDMNIGEILDNARETVPFFLSLGMHCLGCFSAGFETLREACLVHGLDPVEILEKVNSALEEARN